MSRFSPLKILLLATALFCSGLSLWAANAPETQRVERLESRVSRLEQLVRSARDSGALLFLFGAVCALWAQNTGRSGLLWFFAGVIFSVVTVLVLLWKNADDLDRRRKARS